MDNLLKLKEEIEQLEELKRNIGDNIYYKRQGLRAICDHPVVVTRNDYTEGDYFNTSENHVIGECKICGKEIFREIKRGRYA